MCKSRTTARVVLNSFKSESLTIDVEEFEWLPLTTGKPKADVMAQIHEVIWGL